MEIQVMSVMPERMVKLLTGLTVSDWIAVVGLIFTMGGALYAWWRWWWCSAKGELKRIYRRAARKATQKNSKLVPIVCAIVDEADFWKGAWSPRVSETDERESFREQLKRRCPALDVTKLGRVDELGQMRS